MNAKDILRHAIKFNEGIVKGYISDMSDADLLVRPVSGANHIAWQLGHLIASEGEMVAGVLPIAKYPALPAGFAAKHTKETAKLDTGFLTKAQYLAEFDKQRAATMAALDAVAEAELDRKITGGLEKIAPNVAALFYLVASHDLMHAGQFAVVRRKLGKPVLF